MSCLGVFLQISSTFKIIIIEAEHVTNTELINSAGYVCGYMRSSQNFVSMDPSMLTAERLQKWQFDSSFHKVREFEITIWKVIDWGVPSSTKYMREQINMDK